jgi:hypothetical protein
MTQLRQISQVDSKGLEVKEALSIVGGAKNLREVVEGSLCLLLLDDQGSPIDLKHSNMVPLLTVIRVEVEEFSVGVTVMKPTHAGLLSCNRTLQGS